MAEEGVTPNEEVDEEEEEEEQSSDDRQTLDDLTVLTDFTTPLDDVDEQGAGNDTLEWEEPAASQSLSTIHTGSRPTDVELMANLVPGGDVIIDEGEIVPPEETVGAELPDVDAELPETEPDPEPVPEAAADAPPSPPPPPAPEEPVVEEEPEEEPVPEPEAAPDEAVQFAAEPAAPAPPPPPEPDDEDDDEEPDSEPEPEAEEVEVENAAGDEDTAIALSIDPGDAAEVTIAEVPDGAVLSAGTDNGNGTWTVSAEDLEGLTITPPADSDVEFTLQVTGEGEPLDLVVTVNAVADAPTATAEDATGQEDTAIALDLGSALTDIDGSESLSITIDGVPTGAVLCAGTDNGDGTWTMSLEDLDGITITPPQDFNGDIPLTLIATSTEADGGDSATTTVPFTVTVTDTIDGEDADGYEDQAISLNIDPAGAASVDLGNIPDGSTLTYVDDQGATQTISFTGDSATLTADQLNGLAITPPADSDENFTLNVTADGFTDTMDVTVRAVADMPTVSAEDATGAQDAAVPLDLSSALTDLDGSEVLSVTITIDGSVPDGTTFSAGTDNGDGTWTFTGDQLDGLTITPPPNFFGEIPFDLTATSTEQDGGDTASTTVPFTVTVESASDIEFEHAVGVEDTAIALSIDGTLIDGNSLSISNIPDGAVLEYVDGTGATQPIAITNDTADLTLDQLNGLQITPPADSDVDFSLTLTADGVSEEMHVTVDADADAPTATAEDSVGLEDNPIDLDLGAALTDIDGSESLSITIQGVPDGAVLSAGTDNGDGSWSLTPGQLTDLAITPPVNFEGDIPLTLVATSTEADGGDFETTEVPFTVTVEPDLTKPDFEATAAEGFEDNTIALDIDPGTVDVVTIGNVPSGAVLSAGTDNGDGTWTVDAGDLAGITITPPQDSDEEFTLTVTGTDVTGITQTLDVPVTVHAVADRPDVTATSVSGDEDTAINLDISAAMSPETTVGVESVLLGGIPSGSTLTYVDDQGAEQSISFSGSVANLSPDQLNGLSITPPQDFNGIINMTATALSEDGGVDVAPFNVDVAAIADLEVVDTAVGDEDTAIALDIEAAPDESVTISGVPDGASLSAGTDNGDGTWTLTEQQLDGLTVTPAADSDADFTLTVSATSTDGADTETVSGTIDVSVAADADAPTLTLSDATGTEDNAIVLNISSGLTDTDGLESLSITISGVPDGASLNAGTENPDGTWTLEAGDLNGLTITPPADSDADFTLSVSATSTDGTDTATTSGTIDVSVAADADTPTLDLTDASGAEDNAITLDIDPGLTDTDGSESLSVTIGDIPDGSTLTYVDGSGDTRTIEVNEGSADLTADQLNGLQITPPDDYSGSFDLSVTATATEADGGDTATTTGTLTVDVAAVADEADLTVSDATGTEDQEIALNIDAVATDASESLSITISGVPDGATLNAGTENQDGTWTLSADDLDGLTITPPADSNEDFQLSVTATTTDGTDTETVTSTLDVSVTGDADAASVSVQDDVGTEDTWIQLHLDAALSDTDGSESLTITISDVPEGAQLAPGTDNEDGTWSVTLEELPQVCILPPDDFSGEITMSLNVTTTENDGDTETVSRFFDVIVNGDADPATVSVTAASGTEDQAIALDIDASTADGSESLSITIGDIPDGATLTYVDGNNETQSITVENGAAELTPNQLNGLSITPPADSDADFTLSIAATTTDGTDTDTETVTASLPVSVAADADTPTVSLSDASGAEDNAIALNIDAGLGDADGSESLSVTISGVPDGATLSAGTENQDGTWTLEAGDLDGLTITPPDDYSGTFELGVTATATEADGGDTATTAGTITVDVAGVADAADLTVSDATGTEDQAISLNIDAGVTDTDGSESLSITISGVPDGASLNAGTENPDGTWTLSADDLDGLTVTPAADSDADFDLSVNATATEADGNANTVTSTVSVTEPDLESEEVSLSTTDANGSEDRAITLDIGATLTDTDGSETVSITISGVPDGATLSAGTDNQDGTWTLDSGDLSGLTILPAEDSATDFSLTVMATATKTTTGDTSTTTSTVNITVDGIADAPELAVTLGSGTESGGGVTPVGYWNVNETSGSTFYDSIGDNDGAMHGSFDKDDSGVFGTTSAEFAPGGSNKYIEVDHSDALKPDSGALTMWFNADSVSGRKTLASSDSSGNDDGGHFSMFVENGQIRLRMQGDNSEGQTDQYGGSVSANEWNQVTVTWGDDGAHVYLNGEEVISDERWTRGLDGNDNPWTFGANQWASSDNVANNLRDYFDGHMDDIAIYDQQLTVDQVTDLYSDGVTDMMNSGDPSIEYPLTITTALADTDGSESLSVTVDGLPDGATLSAGTENQDGTWTLESGDLSGLTVTVPSGSDDFMLNVSATATDEGGDTRTAMQLVQVDTGDDGFDADDDIIDAGAGDDQIMGGAGDDLFIFGSGDGADYFNGGDGWSDTVQLEGVDSGPGGDSGWTLQVDEGTTYTETESGVEFDAETSGSIVLADGSELTFDNVEKLEW